MDKNALISMNIDNTIVTDVLNKQIKTAIVRELDKMPELIDSIVNIALKNKVTANGEKSKYDSDNKYDFIDIVSTKAIQEQAKIAIKEWIRDNSDKIKNALKKVLDKNTTSIATSMLNSFINNTENSYGISVHLDIKKQTVY